MVIILIFLPSYLMVEGIIIGFSDTLSIAQTVGIVGTMVLTLFFSKKQIQSLSIDTQTTGLSKGNRVESQSYDSWRNSSS